MYLNIEVAEISNTWIPSWRSSEIEWGEHTVQLIAARMVLAACSLEHRMNPAKPWK